MFRNFTIRHAALAAALCVLAFSAQGQGDAASAYQMARHYSGLTGEVVDQPKAYLYLQQAAKAGHVQAQVDLAFVYFNGNAHVKKDAAAALTWFRKAARGGSVAAECMLGDFHMNGLGGARRDPIEAVKWYRLTAEKNDPCAPRSQHALYRAYADGAGVPRNMKVAMEWLHRAAEAGNPRAQAALGRAYASGAGVPRDDGLARLWLRKSREGVSAHDDHEHDLPSFAGPMLLQKLAPFSPQLQAKETP
jgi:uncharacterized protein